jgi:hypothetical protein
MALRVTSRITAVILSKAKGPVVGISTRQMAMSAAPQKIDWLVIIPDHEGVLENRMKVRP